MMDSGDKNHDSWPSTCLEQIGLHPNVLILDLALWSTQLETVTLNIKEEFKESLPKIDVVHQKVLTQHEASIKTMSQILIL